MTPSRPHERHRPNPALAAPHIGWFLFATCASLAADAVILVGMGLLGYEPLSSRLVSLGFASVTGWLINRTWTYRYPGPPSLKEFARHLQRGAAGMAANYAFYVLALIIWPSMIPVLALLVASLLSVALAFAAYCRHSRAS